MPQCNLLIPEITSKTLVKSLIVSYVSFVSNSEQFYNKILAYFERKLKVKETSCKFFYISNLFESKGNCMKTKWCISLEVEVLWNSLDLFWKALIKTGKLKNMMILSLADKKARAVELLGNFSQVLVI